MRIVNDVEDQAIWLEISEDAKQVELHGGHDISSSTPEEVAAEIEAFLAAPRGLSLSS